MLEPLEPDAYVSRASRHVHLVSCSSRLMLISPHAHLVSCSSRLMLMLSHAHRVSCIRARASVHLVHLVLAMPACHPAIPLNNQGA